MNGLSSVLQSETQGGRTFLTCVHCGLECANKSTLGWRIAKVLAAASKPMLNRLKHSMEGMPSCSGCTQLLSSSSRLQKHIEKGACPHPIEAQLEAPEQPKSESPTQQRGRLRSRAPISSKRMDRFCVTNSTNCATTRVASSG